nr:ribonuclease H-like domain-containing protein [Tanacetum cinerariifolium]
VNVATISQDTASAYIASQSNGSQIKFKDINQINEDDIEEMDIKWNMALLSMRADKFWKRTGKKISIQGSDVAGFDKSKVECFNCHKMNHFARECRAPRSQERGKKESYRQGSKAEEISSKALMAIDGVEWDWSYMTNKEDHALVADEEAPTEFALMANTKSKVFENSPCLNKCKKNTDSLNISTSAEGQNKDSYTSEDVASPNPSKPFVKFVKPKDSQPKSKTKEQEIPKKSLVKYAEQYRHSNKIPKGNQRNWNNLKSYQLGPEVVLHKKPCFNCGDFSHLANECRRRVQRETTRSQKYTYESPLHRSGGYRPYGGSMRPSYRPAGHRPLGPSMNPRRPTMNSARPYKSSFKQAPSYETRPFLKSSAVRTQYRAPWVPTVNRNNPPVSRKFSTDRRNFPTVTKKFPTASRKFTTGSTKNHTADMGRKRKAVKPSACWTWNPL